MKLSLSLWAAVMWAAVASCAIAQDSSTPGVETFQFDEPAGPYATGFKVVEQYDYSRKDYTGGRARPLQTLIWYPAKSSGNPPMTVGDYTALLKTETTFGVQTEAPAAAKELLAGLSSALPTPLRAVRDAPAASGRFPVIIYAPGFSSTAWENADLCEYLASHGYVVIATPSLGATAREMTKDLVGIDTQARDISFLIGYAQTLGNADVSQVAAMGFSWGSLGSLFAAARDRRIDALISLDGSIRFSPAFVQQAGDVHPEQMTLPLLSIAGAPMTLEYEERVMNEAERRGPNVLNAWTHGDLIDVHLLGFVHWHHTSMYQRNEWVWKNHFPLMQQADYDRQEAGEGYRWLARYTLAFLNGYLKHDAAALAYLRNTPRENGVPKHLMSASFRAASARPASKGGMNQVTPAQVDQIFSRWNRPDSPGCALAVLHDGETVYTRGYGMADLSHDVPIAPSTPFHVASVSKQFTAAAIMLLEEQGKLALDDDVRRYIPELHDFGMPITLRNLLQHTSGLRDQWGLLVMAGYRYSLDLITDDDVMNLVRAQRELNFTPGSKFMYSNTGFTLAAQIVKRISGQSLREFTTRNLFDPLEMKSTHFRDDHAEINRGEAWGYVPAPGGKFRLSVTNFDTVGPTSLYTTVQDLARWDENFYQQRVGGASFNARMTRLDPLTSGGANYFAMGLMMLEYRGLPIVEHSGGDAGYRSEILRFPDQHFSVVCLCNTTAPAPELARKVADLYLADRFPVAPAAFVVRQPDTSTRNALVGKAGIYRSRETGIVMRLEVVDGSLHTIQPAGKMPLRSDGQGHYLVPESLGPARFEPAKGHALRVVTQGEGEPPEIWDRLAAYTMPSGAATEFVGNYASDELATSYAIVVRQGQLALERKKYPPDVLAPIAPDLFLTSQGGTVQFTRSATGAVQGLLVTGARVQNVKFVRRSSSVDAR